MKASKTEQFKQRIADVASQAYVGYRSGEFNTTRSKMRTSMESVGIIDSILTVDSVLYVIAYRAESITQFNKDHEHIEPIKEYYNCQGDINAYSVYELLMPITNIDLKREVLDPRTLIGSKVMVSEINGLAVKAELITNIDEFNESPLKIPRALLSSIRNYIGAYTRMDSDEDRVTSLVDKLGLTDTTKKLYDKSANDFSGKVWSYDNNAVYGRDTAKLKDGEDSLKPIEGFARHVTNESMKTKNCHLPVKLFSAR